jgi:hypothetical protein
MEPWMSIDEAHDWLNAAADAVMINQPRLFAELEAAGVMLDTPTIWRERAAAAFDAKGRGADAYAHNVLALCAAILRAVRS